MVLKQANASGRMTTSWEPLETTTHQDHVIAHVVDATVLGYVILDETLYVLLDIGFIWTIYLDGEMVLLPQSLAVRELEVSKEIRRRIQSETDHLIKGELDRELEYMVPATLECTITEVNIFAAGDQRRLVVSGAEASLAIETSLATSEMKVYEF